ncbi:MAG: lamin tail domain-containing protein, partial [Akkermansiaceae bacterium]|nr:lamin tail domain-containing protein [Akkermansiaceae bacterium]
MSEINYRPGGATSGEANRGFDVRTDFEWIEVMNIGDVAIDLRGVQFTDGIQFKFDLGDVHYLTPGQRAVVVSNRDAFETRYSEDLSEILIAGEFTNNLSNDG